VHDGDIAGQQFESCARNSVRTQVAHQAFIEKAGRGIARRRGVENAGIDREIALAATGGDNHVHPPEDFLVAVDPGAIQRKPGGIGPDPLPGFHLTLIALFGDRVSKLPAPRDERCRRESFFIDVDAPLVERVPVRVSPSPSEVADHAVIQTSAVRVRDFVSVMVMACCGSRYAGPRIHVHAQIRTGEGMWLKVRVALHLNLPSTRTWPR